MNWRKPVGVLVLGCGVLLASRAEPTPTRVVFYPDWFPAAQFAGIYMAQDGGHYAAAGLNVEVRSFAYGQDATAQLAADPATCTLGSIEGYILLQRLDQGDDLVAFRPILRESPAGVMSFAAAGIKTAADFAHRPVGVHAYADPLFHWFARHAGLADDAPRFVRVEDDVADLIDGKVDAMQGYATEEYIEFQARVAPRPTRFLSFAAMGFPSYSEILYTTRAQAERYPAVLATFVEITRQGWGEVYRNPTAAVDAVARRVGPTADVEHIAAAIAALRPYIFDANGDALAPMASAKWEKLTVIAREMALIEGDLPPPEVWLHDGN